ncbi:CHASE domain-containing protein [Sideroxydans lithotrophicus]|uniref:CHASE domain protein n=1 Tax=Sideroxydans lithotrophicus (strain ES-1) TaxID=580332 RepID=D5CRF7_SIDLE|nr:CHASE domain-containing protein [Sideroxydans lithotrophicus]ADE11543.1 CHASE domain protein [Sideroxydans lithotrophicus ES-1]
MTKHYDRFGLFLRFAPIAVLLVGLLLTWFIWDILRQHALHELQSEFNSEVKEIHNRIDDRLDDYRNLLRGTAGLFAASGSVERKEFHDYVTGLDLEQTFPGIQGLGFAQLLSPREKQRLITAIRREGFPNFSIKPEGVRDQYSAIVYLEPFDWRNQRAFGYDMYSEPVRREAMQRARDENAAAMSGRVVLLQETATEVQSGFLMYFPVFRNNRPHATIEERRNNLVGWVYQPFRMNELMNKGVLGRYLDTVRDELDIEIYDGTARQASNIMFHLDQPHSADQPRFVSTHTIRYFGRDWTVVVRSLPAFEAKLQTAQLFAVAIGGIVISLLLTLVVWLLATTNTRAIALAERMSEKLARTLDQTISAMAAITEMRDPYTAGHQRRAADLARAIASELDVDGERYRALSLAAMTYEIGKIQIPAEILSKPGRLDELEFNMVKTHAQAGFEILQEIDFPWPIAKIVQQHHERLDGSGYPLGLKDGEIMLEARIIAVADVVEAMCSHRPYRPALGIAAALTEIIDQRGTLYDPAVVDACVTLFRDRGFSFSP